MGAAGRPPGEAMASCPAWTETAPGSGGLPDAVHGIRAGGRGAPARGGHRGLTRCSTGRLVRLGRTTCVLRHPGRRAGCGRDRVRGAAPQGGRGPAGGTPTRQLASSPGGWCDPVHVWSCRPPVTCRALWAHLVDRGLGGGVLGRRGARSMIRSRSDPGGFRVGTGRPAGVLAPGPGGPGSWTQSPPCTGRRREAGGPATGRVGPARGRWDPGRGADTAGRCYLLPMRERVGPQLKACSHGGPAACPPGSRARPWPEIPLLEQSPHRRTGGDPVPEEGP